MSTPSDLPDGFQVIVIGGGAAGLMCAIEAGRRGRRVCVIEHARQVGRKILMSGGGRCNFTNLYVEPDNFLSQNPAFCRSALARFTQWQFIERVDAHGIAWHEKELGQLFCDLSSKQIVAMLRTDAAQAGVEIRTGVSVSEVEGRADGGFRVRTSNGPLAADSLVVATGGLSIPKMGATGFGYELAERFGHSLLPRRAGLVPLTLSGRPLQQIEGLAGVSLPVLARAGNAGFRGPALFTHRGISGPSILQVSSYWREGEALTLDLLPDADAVQWLRETKRAQPSTRLEKLLATELPRRLAERLVQLHHWNGPLQHRTYDALAAVGQQLNHWPVRASGTEGYRTAEVTLGGVDTTGLDSRTMESRRVPGLYFVGEVVDVTGHLGGFNFQWAWASGHAAGQVC